MSVPSLQEIAAMPYPASLIATRRYYDALWNVPPEVNEWRVQLRYEVREDRSTTYIVEARTAGEAEAMAIGRLEDEEGSHEVDYVFARPVQGEDEGTPLFPEQLH